MGSEKRSPAEKNSIFISCRHEDINIAKTLQTELIRLSTLCVGGIEVDLYEDIQGGEEWRIWIEENIRKSKVFIFVYTDEQIAYRWCHFEMGLYKGMHYNDEYHLMAIISPFIDSNSDPIRNLQPYSGEKEGLNRLFKHLFYGKDSILGNTESTEKFIRFAKDVDNAINAISSQFTPLILTQKLFPELVIELSRTDAETNSCGGKRIDEIDIDNANLHLNRIDKILQYPQTNCLWKELYSTLQKKNQHGWMDSLKEIIENMRSTRYCEQPFTALNPIKNDTGESYIPVFSFFEKFRDRVDSLDCGSQEYRDILKKIVVNFVPNPKKMKDFRSIFNDEMEEIFAPASLVRVKWKKMSGIGDYLMHDLVEAPDVVKFNKAFQKMFHLPKNAGKKGTASLTVGILLNKLKNEDCIDYLKELEEDQARLAKKIIFDCVADTAKVPLQFNQYHPDSKYKNAAYLPYMICKQTVGDTIGPHETLYFVCYILDFWPTNYSKTIESTGQ